MENDSDLSIVAEVENYDADLTTDASKTNEEDDDMNILDKEEQKTVVYQEILKIYVENIDKNIKTAWRPIYEVIDAPFFEETNIFPQDILDLYKIIQIKISFYHLMSKKS